MFDAATFKLVIDTPADERQALVAVTRQLKDAPWGDGMPLPIATISLAGNWLYEGMFLSSHEAVRFTLRAGTLYAGPADDTQAEVIKATIGEYGYALATFARQCLAMQPFGMSRPTVDHVVVYRNGVIRLHIVHPLQQQADVRACSLAATELFVRHFRPASVYKAVRLTRFDRS